MADGDLAEHKAGLTAAIATRLEAPRVSNEPTVPWSRRVRYCVATSIDGWIAPDDGSVDWLEPFAGGEEFADFVDQFGGIVMGRHTFDLERSLHRWSYAAWPVAVMTHRPVENPPQGVATFAGDPRQALDWLHAQERPGDVWLFGGGTTASDWLEGSLIDLIELSIVPVILGAGRPLFRTASGIRRLQFASSNHGKNGIQHVVYKVGAAGSA